MEKNIELKNYEIINGLGKITFTPKLLTEILKKVLASYPDYSYSSHSISSIDKNYYEITIAIKAPHAFSMKDIDHLQRDLVLVLKQSLGVNCVVIINVNYDR